MQQENLRELHTPGFGFAARFAYKLKTIRGILEFCNSKKIPDNKLCMTVFVFFCAARTLDAVPALQKGSGEDRWRANRQE